MAQDNLERGTVVSPMTVGGTTMSVEQLGKAGEAAAAEAEKDGKGAGAAEAGKDAAAGAAGGTGGKDGIKGTDGTGTAGGDQLKPGVLYRDGKPIPEGEYIPRARLNDELEKMRTRMRTAGLDPETGKPAQAQAEAGKDAAPQAPPKGQEPWAKDLVEIPKQDAKDKDGNPLFGDTSEWLQAVADAKAHNKVLETLGLRAWRDEQARLQREVQAQRDTVDKNLSTFKATTIPETIKKRGLTQEQFDATLGKLTSIPPDQTRDTFIFNYAVHSSPNGADLLLALGEEAATPEGLAYLTRLATLPEQKLLQELAGMDKLVQLGLTVQGKPRAAAAAGETKELNSTGGDSKTVDSSRTINPSPDVGRGGSAAKDPGSLVGTDHFAHMEAEQKAQREARMKRLQAKA